MSLEIAVIGGGNGCYAAAADLSEKGHHVRWWRRNAKAFETVISQGKMTIKDLQGQREVDIPLASTDLAQVVKGAQLIIIPLPAPAHEDIAKTLAPHLEDGQVILLPPGTFGSVVMAKTLREAGCRAEVVFAESGTLPYLARKHGSDTISISGRATRLPTGVFPAEASSYAFSIIKQAYPAVEPLQDALDGALMNAGPIIHPPLILMNAGPIEHFDRWDIHHEGTQPSIRRIHDLLDAERITLREKLGYGAPHFPLANHYDQSPDSEEWMYGKGAHERLVDGRDWYEPLDLYQHRYMREDIACGLAFLVSVADWAGVATPVAKSLLTIASGVVGEDLRKTGRTLENLQLDSYSLEELKAFLKKGMGVLS